MTRQSASNTQTGAASSSAKVIVVGESTPTRPAKRGRKAQFATPRRTSARLAEVTPKSSRSPQKSKRGARAGVAVSRNNNSDDDDDESSDASSGDDLLASVKKNASVGQGFVHENAFDAYFAAASKPSRTSNNVFSQLVAPLSPEEHTALLRASDADSKNAAELAQVRQEQEALFPRYALELSEGFNLLFFGFGSKRTLLNSFARKICATRGHIVVVNAFQPRVGIRDLLACIEDVPGLIELPLTQSGPDAQACRIYDFFLPPAARPDQPTSQRPLFLIIHNIDAPAMRAPRAKAVLSLLAMSPRIHIVASIDHAHAQTLWSTAEASARKHAYMEGGSLSVPPTRGFAWAWHDLTTMEPYDAELAHVDVTRLPGKTSKAAAAAAERAITETAAQHILASVNEKARKLFVLLARTLLAEGTSKSASVSYSALFNAAREDFIATNDTSFKALLAEFRDHKLVVASMGSAGEMLGIPLRPEELRRLVAGLVPES